MAVKVNKPRAYRSPRRSAAALETRERLVASAAELLHGLEGTRGFSLDAVAKAAGVTRLTVYNQFGSRRALLEAVFDDRAECSILQRMPEVMSDPDPVAGLQKLIIVFCDFWNANKAFFTRLIASSVGDPEFTESIRARNERRRVALSALVRRIAEDREIRAAALPDLVDVLFVLTSFPVFAEFTNGKRTARVTCRLIQRLANQVVESASRNEG